MLGAAPDQPSIEAALDEFVAARRDELPTDARRDCEEILTRLRDSLNLYAYASLDADDRRRRKRMPRSWGEATFCRLFGPEKLVDHLGEFFGYFMIRKAMADQVFLHSTGIVVAVLVRWLGERGYVDPAAVAEAVERAEAAARDLPRASRLTSLLHDAAQSTSPTDLDALADEDCVEDLIEITRVEPGALWFSGDLGPVPVPEEAARFAEVGWSVDIVLARMRGGWRVIQVGNVYLY